MTTILCIGDSIVYGAWDPKGGWVARLRAELDTSYLTHPTQDYHLVYNLGVSGATTQDVIEALPRILATYESTEPAIAIVSLGTNDSIWDERLGAHLVPQQRYEQNLDQIITTLKAARYRVLVLGSLPVDITATTPYRHDRNLITTNGDISAYEHSAKKVCAATYTSFIEVFGPADMGNYVPMLSHDGIHPGAKGHTHLAELVTSRLQSLGWLSPSPT